MAHPVNPKIRNLGITQNWYSINESSHNSYIIQHDYFIRAFIPAFLARQGILTSDIIISHKPQKFSHITNTWNNKNIGIHISFLIYTLSDKDYWEKKAKRKLQKDTTNLYTHSLIYKNLTTGEEKRLRRILEYWIKKVNTKIRRRTRWQREDRKRRNKALAKIFNILSAYPQVREWSDLISTFEKTKKNEQPKRPSLNYLLEWMKKLLEKRNENAIYTFDIRNVRNLSENAEILTSWMEYNMNEDPKRFKGIMYKALNLIKSS